MDVIRLLPFGAGVAVGGVPAFSRSRAIAEDSAGLSSLRAIEDMVVGTRTENALDASVSFRVLAFLQPRSLQQTIEIAEPNWTGCLGKYPEC